MAEYVKRYPRGERWDEAYFLLAQFLETDSPFRDIARAREIYTMILTAYPESKYAGASRDRIRYIEQHFYYVR
jgi:outer membrane protein assembly factor BamD (BamD/ComL family)